MGRVIRAAMTVVVAAALAFAAGCRQGQDAGTVPHAAALPRGVVAVWGTPGRIDGMFYQPRVIDCVGDRVCVIDRTGRVQFLDPAGKFLGKFTLAHTEKGYPTGMAVAKDASGADEVWIAETHAYRVGVYAPEGGETLSIGGEGRGDGQFIYVTDVALAPGAEGSVYASEFGGVDRIQRFTRAGKFVGQWGSTGTEPGQFRRPQALAVAEDGSVFVADACNDRIQKFSADGKFIAAFGTPGTGQGQLRYPYDLAISPEGVVYIAEWGNCRVQRMSRDGRFFGTWGKPGSEVGRLAQPWGLAVDGRGTLYVLDSGNTRVVVLDPAAAQWTTDDQGA